MFLIYNKFFSKGGVLLTCVNMWDADLTSPNVVICPGKMRRYLLFLFSTNKFIFERVLKKKVTTQTGKTCQFPFSYAGRTYTTCTVNGPNNPSYLPQCMTSGTWDICIGKH